MSYQDRTSEVWPDTEARKQRQELLLDRLSKFFDEFVEGDGGWAKVEREHIEETREIVQEIVDLKFERDPDGDQTVEIAMVNRREARMEAIIVPYGPLHKDRNQQGTEPELDDDAAVAEDEAKLERLLYAQRRAADVVESVNRELSLYYEMQRSRREYRRKFQDWLARLNDVSENGTYDEARTALLDFRSAYGMQDDLLLKADPYRKRMADRFGDEMSRRIQALKISIDGAPDREQLNAVRRECRFELAVFGPTEMRGIFRAIDAKKNELKEAAT